MQWKFIILGLLVALAVIGWLNREAIWPSDSAAAVQSPPLAPNEQPAPMPQVEPGGIDTPSTSDPLQQPVEPQPVDPQPIDSQPPAAPLPELAVSDAYVREQVNVWTLPPTWLQQKGLAARTAALLSAVAQNQLPKSQVKFARLSEPFQVQRENGKLYAHPDNYQRFTPLVEQLTALPPVEAVQTFTSVSPLLDQALQQLGERRSAKDLLMTNLAAFIALPAPAQRYELVQNHVLYDYADERLQALPEWQKQVLRLGPDNVRRLQGYARELLSQLRLAQ